MTTPCLPCSGQIEVTRGANDSYLITIKDASGNRADITGAKLWFTVKNRVEDTAPVIRKRSLAAGGADTEILVLLPQTGSTKGTARVFLLPQDSANLDPKREYWADAFFELAGTRVQVIKNTKFVINPAVTTNFAP